LERVVSQLGGTAAVGVFTGELTDADGSHIGMGSRRCTAVVEIIADRTARLARLGPVDVNLLGFRVTVAEVTVDPTGLFANIRPRVPSGNPCRAPDQTQAFQPQSSITAGKNVSAARPRPNPTAGPRRTSWSTSSSES
jgi:hypothetical protein